MSGKHQPADEAARRARHELQAAAVGERGALDDGETEACATRAGARIVEAGERAPQALGFILRESPAPVAGFDGNGALAPPRLPPHRPSRPTPGLGGADPPCPAPP